MEDHPGKHLRHDEEEYDVHAQKTAKIPRRLIYGITVCEQHKPTGKKQHDPRSDAGCAEAHAHDGIATGFQESGRE